MSNFPQVKKNCHTSINCTQDMPLFFRKYYSLYHILKADLTATVSECIEVYWKYRDGHNSDTNGLDEYYSVQASTLIRIVYHISTVTLTEWSALRAKYIIITTDRKYMGLTLRCERI